MRSYVGLLPGVGAAATVMVVGFWLADIIGRAIMAAQGLSGGSSPISGVPVAIQVKVGDDMGIISLYTSGADGLVKVMRTSGERIGFAVDGDVFIMSRGTGPFATREVLAEVLDRLAKVESMGTVKRP